MIRAQKRIAAQKRELDVPYAQRKKVIHEFYARLKVCRNIYPKRYIPAGRRFRI